MREMFKLIWSIIGNIRKRGTKDILNKNVWKTYEQYSDIKANGLVLPEPEIVAYAEQLIVRMSRCKACVVEGACSHCGCSVPGKMMAAGAVCSDGKWSEMKSAEDWNKEKQESGIQIVALG